MVNNIQTIADFTYSFSDLASNRLMVIPEEVFRPIPNLQRVYVLFCYTVYVCFICVT